MKILGLPGVNPVTLDWMRSLLAALSAPDDEISIREYRHWREGVDADRGFEASRLEGLAADLVVAKSMGTLVAVEAWREFAFRPRRALLIGCPLRGHGRDGYAALKTFAGEVPSLFIQQTDDPVGGFAALAAAMAPVAGARLAEVAGDDHAYRDIDALAGIVAREFAR